jgi:hypothetical protein
MYLEDATIVSWLRHEPTLPTNTQNIDILKLVEALESVNGASGYSVENRRICHTAIIYLREFFATVPLRPLTWDVIFTWPVTLSDDFLGLVEREHPVALIILAHWCVPVFRASDQWLLRAWDEKIIESVARTIGTRWQFAIRGLLERVPKANHLQFAVPTFAEQTEEEARRSKRSKSYLSDSADAVKLPRLSRHPLVDERLRFEPI